MIRVRHEALPAGLSAVVRRRPGGDADVVVSTLLSPARQRAAVRVGLRAARPAGRRSVLPIPLAGVLALGWASARAIAKGIRLHPAALVASAGVVTAATAAAVVITVLPNQHGAAGGGHPTAGALPAPPSAPGHSAGQPGPATQPAGPHSTAQPSAPVVPVADRTTAATSRPAPAPSESAPSSGPAPSPSAAPSSQPSPTPSAGGGGPICLELLGVRVCL